MRDPYLYPKSDVFINKLGITDSDLLKTAEADFTAVRLKNIFSDPIKGNFDFKHYCDIHFNIFKDLYDWAGVPRAVNIEKFEPVLGGISIEYTDFNDIKSKAISVLNQMNSADWGSMTVDDKAINLSKFMAELWQIHAFREGNTRTTVTFFGDFAQKAGFSMDMDLFANNSAYLRSALVAASAKFKDLGDKSKPEYLIRIVKDAIVRGKPCINNIIDDSKQRAAKIEYKARPNNDVIL